MCWEKVPAPYKDAIMNHLKVNKLFRLKRLLLYYYNGSKNAAKTSAFSAAFAAINALLLIDFFVVIPPT
ncbi:hypothetical protein Hanom_Chr11g00970711 [Helianthus anomalus]